MSLKRRLFWKFYFFLFVPLPLGAMVGILFPESVIYSYYHVLIAFDPTYYLPYYLNVISAYLNLLSLIPLFLFAFGLRFLHPRVWQTLFILRAIFDIVGHRYEYVFIQSLLLTGAWPTFLAIAISLAVIFPSYLACYRYAFGWEKFLSKPTKT